MRTATRVTRRAATTIHGTELNNAKLEGTLPKSVAHTQDIGRNDGGQSIQLPIADD